MNYLHKDFTFLSVLYYISGTEHLLLYEQSFEELNPTIATGYAWSWMEEVEKGERNVRLSQ